MEDHSFRVLDGASRDLDRALQVFKGSAVSTTEEGRRVFDRSIETVEQAQERINSVMVVEQRERSDHHYHLTGVYSNGEIGPVSCHNSSTSVTARMVGSLERNDGLTFRCRLVTRSECRVR